MEKEGEEMIRLETVEDFEKVRKALQDPNSQPRDLCICPYSYCWHCEEVTEFDAPYGPANSITVKCLGCGNFFTVDDYNSAYNKNNIFWGLRFSNDTVSEVVITEMRKLNSREMQTKFFAVELERRIAKEKGELRRVQNRIQKFAKLRS